MRRFWLLVMAALMLGQGSYMAAGAYCLHEGEPFSIAAHWGHHFHSHSGEQQAKGSPDAKASFDGDCAFCHAAGFCGTASFVVVDTAPQTEPLNAADLLHFVSRSPDAPERPQWREPALA